MVEGVIAYLCEHMRSRHLGSRRQLAVEMEGRAQDVGDAGDQAEKAQDVVTRGMSVMRTGYLESTGSEMYRTECQLQCKGV